MQIAPKRYCELLDDPAWPALEREYAQECGLPELMPADPQRALYAAMEASGGLQCFGVYSRDVLVGFLSLLTWTVPHYGKTIVSTESIYLSHGQPGGLELIAFAKRYGRERSARMLQITAPYGSRMAHLLSMLEEFRHSNEVYVASL